MIKTIGYPRAALVGNPSDGFNGRTIAFTFENFSATAILKAQQTISILDCDQCWFHYESIESLNAEIAQQNYTTSIALQQATIRKFVEYCENQKMSVQWHGFQLETHSDIPYQVGFAGSSAIIIAVLRALTQHYAVSIEPPVLASLALSVETEELDIPGGLQDRVTQVYQGLVYMDFDNKYLAQQGYGYYRRLDTSNLPSLYIAWRQSIAEGSEVFHHDIRQRFNAGDQEIIKAVEDWRYLTNQFLAALENRNVSVMHDVMNQNFDRRAQIYRISEGNREMIRIARECGASAKFTGSGGAAIGIYHGEEMYQDLERRFSKKAISLFKPQISNS
ncbi:MAG: hypothetical protein KTR32_35040 [Granulosicoccus sp.]|nr:hypothetical protein [Granulosicoccus sp.]